MSGMTPREHLLSMLPLSVQNLGGTSQHTSEATSDHDTTRPNPKGLRWIRSIERAGREEHPSHPLLLFLLGPALLLPPSPAAAAASAGLL